MIIHNNTINKEIKFKINNFPDSQQLVELLEIHSLCKSTDLIWIKQSIKSFRDIELIINAVAALRNNGFRRIQLYIPYFLGARSDRAFTYNGVHYLRDVICPIINNLNLECVTLLDPHSDVLPSLINRSVIIDNRDFINNVIKEIDHEGNKYNITVVAPDHGAEKKVYPLVKRFPIITSVVVGTKERNLQTGEITRYSLSGTNEDYEDRHILVIDDICDGGATFLQIAEKIKSWFVKPRSLNLAVTHGIFSKGFDDLLKYYYSIFTTDSYSEHKYNPTITNFVYNEFIERVKIFKA